MKELTGEQPMIFVFGSNKAGIHGAGAARYALKHKKAEWGVGEGLTGHCYALPTKDENIDFMPLSEIKKAVNRFIATAERYPNDIFQVTQIGCGLAGWSAADIAPLFKDAPNNCWFDSAWKPQLGEGFIYWGTI